jgi:hypothetical protein
MNKTQAIVLDAEIQGCCIALMLTVDMYGLTGQFTLI